MNKLIPNVNVIKENTLKEKYKHYLDSKVINEISVSDKFIDKLFKSDVFINRLTSMKIKHNRNLK